MASVFDLHAQGLAGIGCTTDVIPTPLVDEEGMRMRTWRFGTREDAEVWRRELEVVWETPEHEIKIDVMEGL